MDHCHNAIFCALGGAVAQWAKNNNIPAYEAKEIFAVNPVFAKKLAKAFKHGQFDLVHVHDSHAHTFAILANVLFAMNAPVIVSRRVDFPVSKSLLSKFKYNHSSVKKIVCVSKAIQAITARSIKDTSVLTTVYSGIDTSRFAQAKPSGKLHKELSLSQEIPLVGIVAALAPHKDYFTFIEMCKILVKQNSPAHFVIVGSGPEQEQVHHWVKESGISDRIHLLGFRKDLPQVIPEFNVFVISSETEGLGTSILDAFACKVPVVVTNAGGIPEIVIHEKTGYLGKVKQPETLAKGVQRFLSDIPFKQQCIQGASQKLNDFSKQNTARETYKIYRTVVG